jgi:hypothetical protein
MASTLLGKLWRWGKRKTAETALTNPAPDLNGELRSSKRQRTNGPGIELPCEIWQDIKHRAVMMELLDRASLRTRPLLTRVHADDVNPDWPQLPEHPYSPFMPRNSINNANSSRPPTYTDYQVGVRYLLELEGLLEPYYWDTADVFELMDMMTEVDWCTTNPTMAVGCWHPLYP